MPYVLPPGGGGTPHMIGVGIKETDLGVAQAFFTPQRDHVKTQTIYIFFSRATLNETLTAKYDGVLPRTF